MFKRFQKSKKSSTKQDDQKKQKKDPESLRETIESVVFAFVLAFLFRAFEAEAFVIPTGSMAPTLYGRHKELDCEKCNYRFQFGASDELIRETNQVRSRIETAICPNCRYENRTAKIAPAFKGDRILVNKFPYQFSDPDRFDVVVFKYPEDAKTNYIKRLVGLPGETIRIHHGNLFRVEPNGRETILRKTDPDKQRILQIPVYDDRYPESALHEAGWPERWAAVSKVASPNQFSVADWYPTSSGWIQNQEERTFQLQTTDSEPHWLRYRHVVPHPSDWELASENRPLEPKAKLIADFCGYNTVSHQVFHPEDDNNSPVFWTPELTLSFELDLQGIHEGAELTMELSRGVHRYRCRFDLNSGEANLYRVDVSLDENEEIEMASASTSLRETGTYDLRFANVDDRLCLWIDGSIIDFGEGAEYETSGTSGLLPQESDLTPIGISMKAANGQISELLIERDIYYLAEQLSDDQIRMFARSLGDVATWRELYLKYQSNLDSAEFEIPDDEFFVLGDNSPRSHDSRFWSSTNSVPRTALVGKAFFIYWPHGIPFGGSDGNGFPISYHRDLNGNSIKNYPLHYVPFYPNIWRMSRIR